MRVVICGAGQVGYNVASYLARDGNDVTIVDPEARMIESAMHELDVNGMIGHYSSPEVLSKAGLADADMIIAVGPNDDTNMVACQVAHSLFDTPKKIARIRNQDYLDPSWNNLFSRDHMPIDLVISPEIEVAQSIYERLSVTGATEAIPVSQKSVYFIGVVCDENCPILHTQLKQLKTLFPNFFVNIVSILRDNEALVLDANSQVLAGDEVFFMVEPQNLRAVMSYLGIQCEDSRNIVILGGGRVGASLAKLIDKEDGRSHVKIIETSAKRAEYLASVSPNNLVIHGDGLKMSILREAEVNRADTIVTVSNEDETNVLCSLQAKYMGAKRAIALIKRSAYTPLLLSSNIDTIVSPQDVTVSSIMHYVRRGRVKAVHKIRGGNFELIEAITSETCRIINQPIRDLRLPNEIKIASIQRDGKFIFPSGDSIIRSGDYVVLFASSDYARKVDGYFSSDVELF